ncbi:MAG: hypothetical protein N2491_06395 [Negativicutes bacterium]|nr:hypothetical protein [Negativicutes bacterium]
MQEQKLNKAKNQAAEVKHVGGINEELGGVEPNIDSTLMRLAGGP